jgi:RHS repeat-associated protein
MDLGGSAVQDRLGSNGFGAYLPYGETVTASTGNDHVMFATYTRDSYTGLDYADQRFYASTYGRFNTPDPHAATAKSVNNPRDPGSWNRYAYTRGDPVNRADPRGLDDCDADICVDVWGWSWGGPFEGMSPAQEEYCLAQMEQCLGQAGQAQGGGGGGGANFSFAYAHGSLVSDLNGLFEQFLNGQQSPDCEADLKAVGVTDAQITAAALSTNIINGFTAITNYAQDVYGNSPLAAAAAGQYGSENMVQFMANNLNVAAVAQLNGSNVYINSGLVNAMTPAQQSAMLLHEMLHNITGQTDDALQDALGLPTNQASQNISDKLQRDCLP